jgi:hypothetical protein
MLYRHTVPLRRGDESVTWRDRLSVLYASAWDWAKIHKRLGRDERMCEG